MYCPNCGAQLPEEAAFCPKCGRKASSEKSQTIDDAPGKISGDGLPVPPSEGKKKAGRKKPFRIVVPVVLIALILIIVVGSAGSSDKNASPTVPTIDQIERSANSLKGSDVTFTKDNDSDYDAYFIAYGDERVGKIYLHAKSEDIGIYIEKDTSRPEEAFAKVCVGTMLACDKSLSTDKAKELLNTAVDRAEDSGNVSFNGVEYRATIPSWRYILRMDVPEPKDENEDSSSDAKKETSESNESESESKSSSETSASEADEMIKNGSAHYAATHSESEIEKLTEEKNGYQKLSDEQKTAILVALGSSKAKGLITDVAKNHLKSPSSFKLEKYSESFDPIHSDDGDKYTVFADMTYSGVNDYNVRKTRTVKSCTCDFTIDLEKGTVSMGKASILDFLVD